MSDPIEYHLNKASEAEIARHLSSCDANFMPSLSDRVDIKVYAQKIAGKATRFEAWSGDLLVGLVAAYGNDHQTRTAYITSVSVLKERTGKGIAARLVGLCIKHMKESGMRRISLEVASDNTPAIKLYEKSGFVAAKNNALFVTMNLFLKSSEENQQ